VVRRVARELRRLFQAYVARKQQDNVLDYDDLLLYWRHAMAEPAVAAEISRRFDHVLVDEYQDTNRLQAEILLALRPDGSGLTVVGDDAQSIYSFRAASVRNILDFPGSVSPPAMVIALERNYRSTQPILAAANTVIAAAGERYAKTLYSTKESAEHPYLVSAEDEATQASYVADHVLEYREAGIALKRQAVLFRAAHHSDLLEIELGRRNIPFVKYGGLKFLEAAHVKDVLAILRWAENPRDAVPGLRALQLLPGIGPATARAVLIQLSEEAFGAPALARCSPPAAAIVLAQPLPHHRPSARHEYPMARSDRARARLVSAATRSPLRLSGFPCRRPRSARADRRRLRYPRAFFDRADLGPA
jgi:DNA helicase-2/ATP-dependent DNA helicase PcrA